MKHKYQVIGSVQQVALVEFGGDVAKAVASCEKTLFSNINPETGKQFEALVSGAFQTKRAASYWLYRLNVLLAFEAGKTGKWISPTFILVKK